MAGQFGEVSEATHSLLDALATCRVRFAGPSLSRRGHMRTEEGERASSLLGRMETLGPGGAAAAGRRNYAAEVEGRWRRERQAFQQATREGWRALRTGFAKLD